MITAVLPVSRLDYITRVLDSLDRQTHKIDKLIVVWDGIKDDSFSKIYNVLVERNPYYDVLLDASMKQTIPEDINGRRVNIADIHNQTRDLIPDKGWVFSIEDDGILPPDAIEKLLRSVNDDTGIVTGVELGRRQVRYVGAWRADDVTTTNSLTSLGSKAGEDVVEEIDACGLYCALIRADIYKNHTFTSSNGLGPDVNLGLFAKQNNLRNHIDWSVLVTHLTKVGEFEMEIPATDRAVTVFITKSASGKWHYRY